jgi:hypothetical protein
VAPRLRGRLRPARFRDGTQAVSKAWKGGSTRRWRKVRELVLAENLRTNGGRCTQQIPGVCTGVAQCVHHVLGKAVTGDDRRALAASCTACNLKIGSPQKAKRSTSPQPRRVSKW